jgi:hypothetical protein
MPKHSIEWQRYHLVLADGGPLYTETDTTHFIVEPWNAVSSLLFLVPAIYWAYLLRGKWKENAFIIYCVPLLILGGLGSTFFHAFRTSRLLLWMDFLPIVILTFSVSVYFLYKLLGNIWLSLLVMLGVLYLRTLALRHFPHHTAINVSYAITGCGVFIPSLLLVLKTNMYKAMQLIFSLVLFCLALVFREIDAWDIHLLPMGTHFIWHTCCAAGAFFLAEYIYRISHYERGKRV